jgi:hypothetical protein
MGTFKQFLASDIIITPLELNKSFNFEGAAALTSSVVGIDRYLGTNITSYPFNPTTDPQTGQISTQYQRLIYTSVKELYYSNYISSSLLASGSYENYLQTTLNFERYFPTASDSTIAVFSIPSKLYGEYIHPTSFYISAESGSVGDDGEGNLIKK